MFYRLNKVSLFNKCSPKLDDIGVCVSSLRKVCVQSQPQALTMLTDIGHPQCSALHPTRLVGNLHDGWKIHRIFVKYGVDTQWMDLSPVQTFV